MYISDLVLNGFKSFPDKTELHFSQGITSVVGPNGCGKTNVVDALRWVLGEQKTKILRGINMQDVIFNGAKGRKPSNFAEVSLTVHNNRGALPIEFNDVLITRRLYRDDRSEYFINRSPCRLKDINDLFMDTGMGTGAYSVIELKMIEDIISDNQENRRRMFDEAAGINKYRQQRKQTLNKYNAVQDDLLRIKDITNEIQRKVRSLKRQLNRFERFETIRNDLKTFELQVARFQIYEKEQQIEPLEKRLHDGREHHSSQSRQVNIDETLVDKYRTKLATLEIESQTAQKTLEEKNTALFDARNRLLLSQEQKRNAERENSRFINEISDLRQYQEGLRSQIRDIEIRIAGIKPKLDAQRELYTTKTSQLEEKQGYLESLKFQLSDVRQQRIELVEDITSLKGQISVNESQIRERKRQIKSRINRIDSLKTQGAELEARLSMTEKENAGFAEDLKSHKKGQTKLLLEIENLRKQTSDLRNQISGLTADIRGNKSRLQLLDEIIISGEGFSSGTQIILNNPEKFPLVLGVVANVISTTEKYYASLETALGETADYLIVKTRNDALKTAEAFKELGSGKISVIALEKIKPIFKPFKKTPENCVLLMDNITMDSIFHPLFNMLIGDVFVFLTVQPEFENGRFVSQDGTLFFENYKITIGAQFTIETKIGRKKQSETLRAIIEQSEIDITKLRNEFEIAERTLAEKIIILETLTLEIGNTHDASVERSTNIAKWQFAKERIVQDIDHCSQQQTEDKNDLENLTKILAQLVKSTKEKIGEKDTSFKVLEKREQDTESEIAQVNLEQEKAHEARIALLNLENNLKVETDRSNRFQKTITESKEKISQKTAQSQTSEENVTTLSKRIQGFEDQVLKSAGKYTQTKTVHDSLQDKLQKKRTEVSHIENQITDTLRSRQEETERFQDLELRITRMQNEIKLVRAHIRDKFNLDIPADIVIPDDFDFTYAEIQIEKKNRILEQIGEINWGVRDEFNEEKERYEFLIAQCEDLDKSSVNLKLTMDKHDTEAKSQFEKTFEKINGNFKKTYEMFFEGGSCILSYANPEDTLNSQINITASPPGKRPRGLNQLSGGEKSLTALSLLFAIYLTKPSPFCILDEVDAPLDDINIGRFGSVLQQFAETTQFIIVTHNKLTMEASDYMYGVTMQKKGVSKIVSVKFTKVDTTT